MTSSVSRPLFSHQVARSKLHLESGAIYLFGNSGTEERGQIDGGWLTKESAAGSRFIEARLVDGDFVDIGPIGGSRTRYSLHDRAGLSNLVRSWGSPTYVDTTDLPHRVWAPLLRAVLESEIEAVLVYEEPVEYRRSSIPQDGLLFDLSEMSSVAPIPGFASILDDPEQATVLVPMLGFEGARFAHALEIIQPQQGHVYPLVGVPGYNMRFPFVALICNRLSLLSEGMASRIVHASAYCPFDTFYTLEELRSRFPGAPFCVAPLGTKPNAIGAVLFALLGDETIELFYDHPVKTTNRTSGHGPLWLYRVSAFADSVRSGAAIVQV